MRDPVNSLIHLLPLYALRFSLSHTYTFFLFLLLFFLVSFIVVVCVCYIKSFVTTDILVFPKPYRTLRFTCNLKPPLYLRVYFLSQPTVDQLSNLISISTSDLGRRRILRYGYERRREEREREKKKKKKKKKEERSHPQSATRLIYLAIPPQTRYQSDL